MVRFPLRLTWIFLILLAHAGWALVGGVEGVFGYSHVPSASVPGRGDAYVFGQGQRSDQGNTVGGGLILSPLPFLEVGASLVRVDSSTGGVLSWKIQLPRMDSWQPLLSVGVLDMAAEGRRWENLYFVGGYALRSSDMMLYLDLGGIYHRHDVPGQSQVSPYFAGELDFGLASIMFEAVRSPWGMRLMPSVWLRPLGRSLVAGGGASWSSDLPRSFPNLWGQLGWQIPLLDAMDTVPSRPPHGQRAIRNEPWIWLDFNPQYDHLYAAGARQYRVGLDIQGVLRTGVDGLYWVNGASLPMAHSRDTSLLVPRSAWDRSYVLFSRTQEWGDFFLVRRPALAVGLLQERTLGIGLWQDFRFRGWNPFQIFVAGYRRDSSDYAATLRLPLHPQGPSILRWAQLYVEGGQYLDGARQTFGGLRIGGHSHSLDVSAGYEFEHKVILARLELRVDLSLWSCARVGPVQIAVLPRVEHHALAVLQDLDAEEFDPSLQGNASQHWSHIPWEPRRWKGDSLVLLPKPKCASSSHCPEEDEDRDGIRNDLDQCPQTAEDRDGFRDEDGCPELDNDGDRILDLEDRCPDLSEDEDGFQDGDGCPELDNDADGIRDSLDACSQLAEDPDGFQDQDGCPDIDNDHDGIRDVEDACPEDPGAGMPGQPRRGCPEGDDLDGIPYERDACPNAPEDYDQFQDTDGCPDSDNDQDGISDSMDRCPNQPEIMDGQHDLDGCP